MTPYVITFIVMVGVFMIGCFAFKLPVGVSMLIAALCGALEGGLGTETIRMMVEGEFGYVDTDHHNKSDQDVYKRQQYNASGSQCIFLHL